MENTIFTKEQFKAIRLHLGLSQKDFAEKLGYKSGAVMISFKENGHKIITKTDTIILMPDYLTMPKKARKVLELA